MKMIVHYALGNYCYQVEGPHVDTAVFQREVNRRLPQCQLAPGKCPAKWTEVDWTYTSKKGW